MPHLEQPPLRVRGMAEHHRDLLSVVAEREQHELDELKCRPLIEYGHGHGDGQGYVLHA